MTNHAVSFEKLPDGRSFLPPGTIVDLLENGGRYRITGRPIGYGGSGILYPAVAMVRQGETWCDGTLPSAIKECYPVSLSPVWGRNDKGEILARTQFPEGSGLQENESGYKLFRQAEGMFLDESRITGEIFTTGFRLTPILHSCRKEILILPGQEPALVHNTIGIMERLDEKGQPLSQILSGQLNGWECFHLFGLVLRALMEVHDASYLHGDIQENNIFVKGWEADERTCELSLVDFGSARRLLEDGATEMIRDKLLFTTKGYAAPECVHGNDGTLRLTPAADLYSVGILLLRMLNGRVPDPRALELAVGSRYLIQRHAKQIGIPSGTVPKINELLAGLLQPDPMQRYQSAGEVLEISDRIEQALAPRTSALEAIDYDAFISYCHEPPASWVAKQVQEKVEHYRIPKTVQRPDGKLKMGKVFLDRTEMTAGTDMEEHLRSALSHSAFLIVILSPGVMESPWVEREIRIFLETHGHDQILTVLAEGEPEEVTPDILLEAEKNVNGIMKKVPTESLAADVRGRTERERKQKLRTEIFRLLAPMMGCGYDDLVRRQKAYRQQRMLHITTAAFLLTATILGVITAQSVVIHRNYTDALKRESIDLAGQSADALAGGDRQKAISLALEALPDPEAHASRPVTDQARAALIRAKGYYQGADHDISAMAPAGMLQMDYPTSHDVTSCESPDGPEAFNDSMSAFASADAHQSVYVWSIPDGELLQVWSVDGIRHLSFADDHRLRIITDSAVWEADIGTGCLEQKCSFPETFINDPVVYLPKAGGFIVERNRETDRDSGAYDLSFELLDIDSGEVVSELSAAKELGTEARRFDLVDGILSADDGSAAVIVLSTIEYPKKSCLLIWYPQEDRVIRADTQDAGIYQVHSVADDALLVLSAKNPFQFLSAGERRESSLSLIHTQSGTCLWSADIACGLADTASGAECFAMREKTYVMFWSGSQIFLLSIDGEPLLSEGAPGRICGAALTADGQYVFCTEEGGIFCFEIGTGTVYNPFLQLEMHADAFFCQPENRTAGIVDRTTGKTVVLKPMEDPEYRLLDMSGASTFGFGVGHASFVLFREDDAGQTVISVYDKNAGDGQILSNEPRLQWTCKGYINGTFCCGETMYFYMESSGDSLALTAYSVETGEKVWQYALPSDLDGYADSDKWDAMTMTRDGKTLLYRTGDSFSLLNLETGEVILSRSKEDFAPEHGRDEREYIHMEDIRIMPDGKTVLALTGSDGLMGELSLSAFNVENETWIDLPEQITDFPISMPYSGKRLFLSNDGTCAALYSENERAILVFDTKDWSVTGKIPFASSSKLCVSFSPDDRFLITWEDEGPVQVLDVVTGQSLFRTEESFSYIEAFSCDPDMGILTIDHSAERRSSYYLTGDGRLVLIQKNAAGMFRNGIYAVIDTDLLQLRLYPVRTLEEMIREAK